MKKNTIIWLMFIATFVELIVSLFTEHDYGKYIFIGLLILILLKKIETPNETLKEDFFI